MDTGGFSDFESDELGSLVTYQVMQAIEEADVIVMLMDGREGATPVDADLVQRLRESGKSIFYTVNKIDGPRHESLLSDFSVLGVDPLHPVSAEHGYGVNGFMDALTAALPQGVPEAHSDRIRLAVIGRPNVGKSSLINRLLGDDRLVVSEIPGTTRDAIDTICTVNKKEYVLIDMAGIRRKARVRKKLEKFSVVKALRSLDRCDIALVMIDASEGITDQDANIASYVLDRSRGCIVLLNKWDLVEKDTATFKTYTDEVYRRLQFLKFAPVLTVSALTGQRVFKIFEWVESVYEQFTTRIGTGRLNKALEALVNKHQPPVYHGKRIKFYYATQVTEAPPTFICFVNYPEGIHHSYKRYLINELRESLGLNLTPVRLFFRKREKR